MKIPVNKIGFDFDGVIADIGEAFIRLACNDHGYCSFALEDITDFHVERCTKVPEKVVRQIFGEILADSLATGLLPIPGALETITELTSLSRVTIITARSEKEPVSRWLEEYLPQAVCRKIELIAMSDHDQKVQYIRKEKLEYFVDDRAETCALVAEAGLTPILFQQPWNRGWNSFSTVRNWRELTRLFHA